MFFFNCRPKVNKPFWNAKMDFVGILRTSLRARVYKERSLRGSLGGNQTRAKRQNGKCSKVVVACCSEIWRKDNAPLCQITAEKKKNWYFLFKWGTHCPPVETVTEVNDFKKRVNFFRNRVNLFQEWSQLFRGQYSNTSYHWRSCLPCTALPFSHTAAWPQGSRHSMYCAQSSKWGLFGRNTRSAFRRTPSLKKTPFGAIQDCVITIR